MWSRGEAKLSPSVDPVGHMELVTRTRAVLMLFPLPRPFSSTWRSSDCKHRTDLGTQHPKGSHWKEQSVPALLCPRH